MPLVLVDTHDPDATVEQPDAICIFKGEGNVFAQEKQFYAARVQVWFVGQALQEGRRRPNATLGG